MFYVARGANQKTIYMHRILKPCIDKEQIDHINRDSLDNRKNNLRICNHSQNQMNRGKQNANTSGYKGVTWDKYAGRWLSSIKLNGKLINLGRFKTKEETALAYNEGAKKYHDEFAKINIIKETHE